MLNRVLSTRLCAYGLIVAFIILKIPHLSYPFFWDESWPYATAVHALYEAGPSLSPSAIAPELSRGHPPLFIFLAASWMKVFGSSLTAIHSFPLCLSAIFAICIYEITRRIFNPATGVLALLLILFQPLFYVQASAVLPEVMLAFFGLLALYFYATERLFSMALALICSFYTKETGLTIGLSLGLFSIFRLLVKDIDRRTFYKHLAAFVVPLIGIICFFIIQKQQLGWYFFPFHVDLLSHTEVSRASKIKTGLKVLFLVDNRVYITISCMALLLLCSWRQMTQKWASIIQEIKAAWRPPFSTTQLFILSFLIFLPVFIVFCAFNFFIHRYFIIAFVPLNMLLAAIMVQASRRLSTVFPMLLLVIGIFHFWNQRQLNEVYDDQLGAYDGMYVEQMMIQYLEEHYAYDHPIASDAYLLRTQITDARTRYLRGSQTYSNVQMNIDEHTQLILFSGKEADTQYERVKQNPDFKLVRRWERGKAWAELYERVP